MDLQVSIPKTSTEDNSYTAYHVIVKLPLRKYELIKRYTDFRRLIDGMERELSAKQPRDFPLSIPPKTSGFLGWLGKNRDLDDHELIEYRRRQFETILRKIVAAEPPVGDEWRQSSVFEDFLELPPGLFANKSTETDSITKPLDNYVSTGNANEAIVDISAWLDIVRECRKLVQLARSTCYNNQQHTRKNLLVVRSKIGPLTRGLAYHEANQRRASDEKMHILGEGELRRRKDLLNSIKQEYSNIENIISGVNLEKYSSMPGSFVNAQETNSNNLFGKISGRRVLGQPLQETEQTRGLNDVELLQQQKQQLKSQDSELEYLHDIIKRQKQMGITINEELDYQNSLLEELNNEVDNTGTKLRYANKKTKRINK